MIQKKNLLKQNQKRENRNEIFFILQPMNHKCLKQHECFRFKAFREVLYGAGIDDIVDFGAFTH